jgi:small subunit ribosomal protein S3Ae
MSTQKGSAIKDKWKMKKWFTLLAPKIFGEISLGSIPVFTTEQAINRKVETTLYDLTGDFSLVHIKLYFKIIGYSGDKLLTTFYGHELSRDYIRSLVRRKSSKIDTVVDITTKDGYGLRIKGLVLTTYRVHHSQKTAIRKIIWDIIKSKEEKLFDDLVKEMVFGNLSNEIFEKSKKICPVRKAEIEKSKVLKLPQELVLVRG